MRLYTSRAAAACFSSLLLATTGMSPVLAQTVTTTTPIKHVVVIFGENISFDHYFGTYPYATNPPGEPAFNRPAYPPKVDNLLNGSLLTSNPNLNSANGAGAANPFRLDRSQAVTSDMNHAYGPEEKAFDDGKMDLFPKYTGKAGTGGTGAFNTTGLVMGYYDGNTVTALWNYALHFAMSDNSYSSQFGPSSPGAINLISGQTNGAMGYTAGSVANQQLALAGSSSPVVKITSAAQGNNLADDGQGGYTMFGDSDPTGDVCSSTSAATTRMTGQNIGDLLNTRGITWGWFEGGFDLGITNANGTTNCLRSSPAVNGAYTADYIPHHQPFQYYASTANLNHARPTSATAIGTSSDGANHQYDSHDFFDALNANNMPAVSFLKAPAYQDAHAGYSDPLDEQAFVVSVVNAVGKSQFWNSTAIIIAYDDSDGWYDHQLHVINPSTVVSSNANAQDALLGAGLCGPIGSTNLVAGTPSSTSLNGLAGRPVNGRCGYGPRQPLLAISPYAKAFSVDHTVTDQASITRFIEDNWLNGQRIGQGSYDTIANPINNMFNFSQAPLSPVILNVNTGTP